MKIRIIFLSLLLVTASKLMAEEFPENQLIDTESGMLTLRERSSDEFYDDSKLNTIYLEFEQADWWEQLTKNYDSQTDVLADVIYDGTRYSGVGVRFRGQTSYMRIGNAKKKSFNISIDYSDEDLRLLGYKTLNLNNCYQDPSFMREAMFSELAGKYIPTAKVNFIKLVINGQNWGVYSNVQQLNAEFFEDWFPSEDGSRWRAEAPDTVPRQKPQPGGGNIFGAGKSSLNYLGDDYITYTSYYTLKTSDENHHWKELVKACKMLHTLPVDKLYDSLKKYIDIDRALWHIACENVFADEDGYINKGGMDYYVYYEPETGRIHPIDYDGNSTFLSKEVNKPPFFRENDTLFALVNKLLASPELKQRYLSHMRVIIENELNDNSTELLLEKYQSIIKQEVLLDDKKLYSDQDFYSSIYSIKDFIKGRRNYLLSLIPFQAKIPAIEYVSYQSQQGISKPPKADEKVQITAQISSVNGISSALLYYSTGLAGAFDRIFMYDDGKHNDGKSLDGIFGAEIPGFSAGAYVRYYIEARADDNVKTAAFSPIGAEHDVYIYQVQANINTESDLVINEIMASNKTAFADPQGEFDDWIEIFNKGENKIDLSGMYLSDKTDNLLKWQFPDKTEIDAGGYLVVFADEDGKDSPGLHANFKLSADGEILMLVDSDENGNSILDSLNFNSQVTDISLGRYPNGTGNFDYLIPSPGKYNDKISSISDSKIQSGFKFVVFPNPATDNIYLEFNLAEDKYCCVSLFNSLGSKMIEFENKFFPEGKNIVNYNLSDYRNSMSQGIYYIELEMFGLKYFEPLIIAK